MKKTILFLAFAFLCIHGFSQARLNSTASEIREEFSDEQYNLTSGFDSDGDYYIRVENDRSTAFYYFENNQMCYMTIIIPDDQGALNMYAEHYNSRYVIISDTKWKMYTSNGIANIELVFTDNNSYFFLWTRAM